MDDVSEQLTVADRYERDQLHDAFRRTLATVDGRRVLFWILERCAIYRDAFTGDNNATNYTLGRQASGRDVIARLDEIDPRFYPQLLMDVATIRETDRAAIQALTEKKGNDDDLEG